MTVQPLTGVGKDVKDHALSPLNATASHVVVRESAVWGFVVVVVVEGSLLTC